MTTTEATDTPRGTVENLPLLDLTPMTSPEELEAITAIRQVALVLVPRSLAPTLSAISMESVAAVIPVPDDVRTNIHTGMVQMGGDALAPEDGDDAVLVVTGGLLLTSPVTQVTYQEVIVTGMVIAPRGSESALGAGLTRVTGAIHYYDAAEGQDVRTLSGQTQIGAATLANDGGHPDDILVAAGQIMVTEPVEDVGFQRIFAAGQIVLPRESEGLLAPRLSAEGQVVWYTGRPRFFTGRERFGRAFFELLDEPTDLALVGSFTLEDDVTPELLKESVSAITLVGKITAPAAVVPVLQLLTVDKYGRIEAEQDDGDER